MRPVREHATNAGHTYMISAPTWGRRTLFTREAWAKLSIETLYHYRGTAYLLHEFVVMPDHIHVLPTPNMSLEKAVQFIKGGFSYRAKKELGSNMEVWQKGFSDHRIRDASDYRFHQIYVQQNPVRKKLCERAEDYPYSSAHSGFELDPAPQGLKPPSSEGPPTARLEGVPFQSQNSKGICIRDGEVAVAQGLKPASPEGPHAARLKGVPFQGNGIPGSPEGAPWQNKATRRRADVAPTRPKNRTA